MTDASEPITAEWLEASGAYKSYGSEWWFFSDTFVSVRPISNGKAWMVIANNSVLNWSATTRGQIDRLRRALKGEV
jgi:hypothetical protein